MNRVCFVAQRYTLLYRICRRICHRFISHILNFYDMETRYLPITFTLNRCRLWSFTREIAVAAATLVYQPKRAWGKVFWQINIFSIANIHTCFRWEMEAEHRINTFSEAWKDRRGEQHSKNILLVLSKCLQVLLLSHSDVQSILNSLRNENRVKGSPTNWAVQQQREEGEDMTFWIIFLMLKIMLEGLGRCQLLSSLSPDDDEYMTNISAQCTLRCQWVQPVVRCRWVRAGVGMWWRLNAI